MKAVIELKSKNEVQMQEANLQEAVFLLAQSIKTLNNLTIEKELSAKRAEEQSKKIKTKIFHFLAKGNVIASIISIILASLISGGAYLYKNIQGNLDELRDRGIGLIVAGAEADTICHNLINDPSALNDFEKRTIWDAHQEMRDQVIGLLKARSKLGKYISQRNYMTTTELIFWSNQLVTSGINLCKIPTKNTRGLLKWRNNFVEEIQKDKERHQQISTFLKDYGNYLGGWLLLSKPLSEQSYKAPEDKELIEKIALY